MKKLLCVDVFFGGAFLWHWFEGLFESGGVKIIVTRCSGVDVRFLRSFLTQDSMKKSNSTNNNESTEMYQLKKSVEMMVCFLRDENDFRIHVALSNHSQIFEKRNDDDTNDKNTIDNLRR